MTIRTSIIMGGMAAAIALGAAGSAGAATNGLFGGGSTLAEKVYRDLFNHYGSTSAGDLCYNISIDPCPSTQYNSAVELLYVGVGSGNGRSALSTHQASNFVANSKTPDKVPVASSSDFGPYYGTGTGSSWVPGTGVGPYFPKVTFAGSDDVLSSTDVSNVSGLGFGQPVQIPTLVASIAIAFNPAPNWNPNGTQPSGGSSKVNLSLTTICGIFSGAIRTWDNAHITADNGGVRLGTGPITVVYRHDGSGTTFLMSNALLNQCGTTGHKVARSIYPFQNRWLSAGSSPIAYNASAKFHYLSNTSFFINAFNKGYLPSNFYNDNGGASGVTGGASGSGGVKKIIMATPGSIGYISPDFVQPVDSTGPQAANLQTYKTFVLKQTPVYVAPTATGATAIMVSSAPPSFSGSPAPAANPLNWGAVNPLPVSTVAYPIGGFTFIDLYTCYASAADVAGLVGTTAGGNKAGFLTWYYGSSTVNGGAPAAILAKNGFAPVPNTWAAAINKLLQSSTLGVNVPGKGACTSIKSGA